MIYDMEKAYETYYGSTDMLEACEIPENVGEKAPDIDSPKIFLVTSASKDARERLIEEEIWEDYVPYLGYRRITMAQGRVLNYTYDYNEDGYRDPSYSHPTEFAKFGGVNWSLEYNEANLMAGAQYKIINNLTESIPWARAAVVLPKVTGYSWQPSNPDAIIRTRFANATHEFLDIRVHAPAKNSGIPTTTIIDLIPEVNGGV